MVLTMMFSLLLCLSFIAYFLIILNIDLLFLIDIFVVCMLNRSPHERYIWCVRLQVTENLGDDY